MESSPTIDLLTASIKRGRLASLALDSLLLLAFFALPFLIGKIRFAHPAVQTASDTARLNQIAREANEELFLIELNEPELREELAWARLANWLSEYEHRTGHCTLRPNSNQHINLHCMAYANREGTARQVKLQTALAVFVDQPIAQKPSSEFEKPSTNCPIPVNKATAPTGVYIGDSTRKTFDAKQELWRTGSLKK